MGCSPKLGEGRISWYGLGKVPPQEELGDKVPLKLKASAQIWFEVLLKTLICKCIRRIDFHSCSLSFSFVHAYYTVKLYCFWVQFLQCGCSALTELFLGAFAPKKLALMIGNIAMTAP